MRLREVTVLLSALGLVFAGCGATSSGSGPGGQHVGAAATSTIDCSGAPAPSTYDHVVWIFMENHHAGDVLGSAAAPYETAVARSCGTAADYRHVARPSLPNYLGATSGATWAVRDDAAPARHRILGDNLFRQVRATGRGARTYAEGMPRPCSLTSQGRYAVKHNPAAYFQGGDDRAACLRDDVPLGTTSTGPLARDIAADALPAFALIIPDLCNDTHDCSVATGDRWLRGWLPVLTGSRAYQRGTTAVFVVWDEPTPMPFLALAPSVTPGAVVRPPVDHYALLRTTEELLRLPLLDVAARAPSMRGALHL